MTNNKKTSEYLYGKVAPSEISAGIIEERIDLLHKNLTKLLASHYLARDNERINTVLKAIAFWENINDL